MQSRRENTRLDFSRGRHPNPNNLATDKKKDHMKSTTFPTGFSVFAAKLNFDIFQGQS